MTENDRDRSQAQLQGHEPNQERKAEDDFRNHERHHGDRIHDLAPWESIALERDGGGSSENGGSDRGPESNPKTDHKGIAKSLVLKSFRIPAQREMRFSAGGIIAFDKG